MSPIPTSPRVPDSWVRVFLRDGSAVRVRLEHLPELEGALDAAIGEGMAQFLDRDDRELVLSLTGLAGDRITLLSNYIFGFMVSTPEGRRLERACDALVEREAEAERPASLSSVEYRR